MRASGISVARAIFARFSLRTQLVILLIVVASVLVVDRTDNLLRVRSEEIARAYTELTDKASAGAYRQADILAEAKALLRMAVEMPADTGQACRGHLRRVQDDLPWLSSVLILDVNGTPICTSTDGKGIGNFADRPYFREALANRGFAFSNYMIGRVTGKPIIVVALPRLRDGIPDAVFAAGIDLDWMNRIARDTGAGAGTKVLLLDKTGTVLAAYPDPEDWVGRKLGHQATFMAGLRTSADRSQPVTLDGETQVVGHAELTDIRAVLAIAMPLKQVISNANHRAMVEIGKIVTTGLLAFLAIWFGGEFLVLRPIRGLLRAAEQIGAGELSVSVSTEGLAPELKRLGEAFNVMASELRRREAELKSANQKLHELASKDALTGIANRRGFDQQLASEWSRAQRSSEPLALLAFDVDHFKSFNDRYGHLAGDACLQQLGAALSRAARRAGDFAARVGGEEFMLMLPVTDLGAAATTAESIRAEIEAMDIKHFGSPEGRVTVSVGAAACIPDRCSGQSTLVDLADSALYRAKRAGRNRVMRDWVAVSLAS